jgi:hypothetical protein
MKSSLWIILAILSLTLAACTNSHNAETPSLQNFQAPPTYGNDAMNRVHKMKVTQPAAFINR